MNSFFARGLAAAAFAMAAVIAAPSVSLASDVTFVMRNSHPNALEVELYSQDRDHVWPGGNQVYYLDDGETKTMPLACEEGETICYGAWISGDKGTYWGVGPDNSENCDNCCYTCTGGETEEIDLVP
ncbi:MAG: hypothetical protein KF694_13995 [Mesorhizobium sp.]|nr:hypothetical protein [Mesorhizobium sp.]